MQCLSGPCTAVLPGAVRRRGSLRRNTVVRASNEQERPAHVPAKDWPATAVGLAAAVAVTLQSSFPLQAQAMSPQALWSVAGLGQNPVKSAPALLRYALPVKNKQIREIQKSLEDISEDLRVPGVRFSGVEKNVKRSLDIVKNQSKAIFADISPQKKAGAIVAVEKLKKGLEEFVVIVDNKDKQEVPIKQQELLQLVGLIEEDMVDGFPFTVPSEFDNLPQLLGRAEVEMTFGLREGLSSNPKIKTASMRIVLDGYNAPVTSGNFLDLVERKFYDNMPVQRSDGFVVQSGDPEGDADGFIDPSTGKLRTVPLEIMVKGDKVPQYFETMEESGRFKEDPALPFNAFGTLAMARGEFEDNNASSQFFFLLKESELTPSGTNILDGRYAVFGYVVEGQEVLRDVKVNDTIKSVKVLSGAENLKKPASAAPAPPPPLPPAVEEPLAA